MSEPADTLSKNYKGPYAHEESLIETINTLRIRVAKLEEGIKLLLGGINKYWNCRDAEAIDAAEKLLRTAAAPAEQDRP